MEKEKLEKAGVDVRVSNISEESGKMLEIVQKSRETPRKEIPLPASNKIFDWDDL